MVRQSGARPAGATDLLQLSPASLAQVAYDERYRALVRWRCRAAPGRWSALRMSKAWTALSIRSSPASTRNGEIGPSKPLHKPFDITGNAKIVALRPCLGYPIRVAIVKKEPCPLHPTARPNGRAFVCHAATGGALPQFELQFPICLKQCHRKAAHDNGSI